MARLARPEPTVPEIVERLHRMQRDIVRSAEWARAADEAFRALNDLGEPRHRLAASPAGAAARLIEQAIIDMQLISTVKLFDPPSSYGHLHTNRISLVIGRQLMDHPGVLDRLKEDARGWPHGDPDANVAALEESFQAFTERLGRLVAEEPNRLERLRNLRNDSVAHNLHLEAVPPRPLYEQIWGLAAEVPQLVEDFSYVADGVEVIWQWGALRWSSERLWTAVADHCRYDEAPGDAEA